MFSTGYKHITHVFSHIKSVLYSFSSSTVTLLAKTKLSHKHSKTLTMIKTSINMLYILVFHITSKKYTHIQLLCAYYMSPVSLVFHTY